MTNPWVSSNGEARPRAQRYRLSDEPEGGRFARFAISPILVGLVAFFLSPLGLLLVGIHGLIINGTHKWRDVVLTVLACALDIIIAIILFEGRKAGWLAFPRDGYFDAVGSTIVFMMIMKVLLDQSRTMALRQAYARPR